MCTLLRILPKKPRAVVQPGSTRDTTRITYRCFLPDLTRFVTGCCAASGREALGFPGVEPSAGSSAPRKADFGFRAPLTPRLAQPDLIIMDGRFFSRGKATPWGLLQRLRQRAPVKAFRVDLVMALAYPLKNFRLRADLLLRPRQQSRRQAHPMTDTPGQTLIQKVRRTLGDFRMIAPGESVLVGVSGGADSVCLLHLLHGLSDGFDISLGIAHFNHALRPEEADRDAEFVARMAESLRCPCHLEKAAPEAWDAGGISLEEAARQARYAFFGRVSRTQGYEKVALGHHAGDNAELFLMRLMTWSGPAGVSGIPPVRKDAGGKGQIIRPLIRCTRDEIEAYLKKRGIPFVEDVTNRSLRFLRNRVRHRLIPQLKAQFNPKIETALNRFCLITAAEEEWMRSLAAPMFEAALICEGQGVCVLSAEKVRSAPLAVQRRMLRTAVSRAAGSLRRITFEHVESARALLFKDPKAGVLCLPGGISVALEKDRLKIRILAVTGSGERAFAAKRTSFNPTYQYRFEGPGSFLIPELRRRLTLSRLNAEQAGDFRGLGKDTAVFDAKVLAFPLIFRNWLAGDRFSPLGVSGTQKVKKYFIDHKVPRQERAGCPVMISNGRIAWVAGHRIAHWARVTPSTKEVLRAELSLALLDKSG